MADATFEIEVPVPATNTADAWNANIRAAADKAGVKLTPEGTTAATAPGEKEPTAADAPTEFTFTMDIGGKEITLKDTSEAGLLRQVAAAQAGATPAPVTSDPAAEQAAKDARDAELFELRVKIANNEPGALETYLDKSGALDALLKSRGLDPAELKAAAEERQSGKVASGWKSATIEFMAKAKAGEIDYPLDDKGDGDPRNTYLMGLALAELGLRNNPSVDSFQKALAHLREKGILFSVEKTATPAAQPANAEPEKKKLTSSTAIGTAGGQETRGPKVDPNRKFTLDMTKLTPHQYSTSWNELIARGVKPEQIEIIQ